eukprot:2288972-Prymnesium_polylepis.1
MHSTRSARLSSCPCLPLLAGRAACRGCPLWTGTSARDDASFSTQIDRPMKALFARACVRVPRWR